MERGWPILSDILKGWAFFALTCPNFSRTRSYDIALLEEPRNRQLDRGTRLR